MFLAVDKEVTLFNTALFKQYKIEFMSQTATGIFTVFFKFTNTGMKPFPALDSVVLTIISKNLSGLILILIRVTQNFVKRIRLLLSKMVPVLTFCLIYSFYRV